MPPIPTPAIFNLSLGALCPNPEITLLGTTVNPAAAAAVVPIKSLLLIFLYSFIMILNFDNYSYCLFSLLIQQILIPEDGVIHQKSKTASANLIT
jgi:hypothetical protein